MLDAIGQELKRGDLVAIIAGPYSRTADPGIVAVITDTQVKIIRPSFDYQETKLKKAIKVSTRTASGRKVRYVFKITLDQFKNMPEIDANYRQPAWNKGYQNPGYMDMINACRKRNTLLTKEILQVWQEAMVKTEKIDVKEEWFNILKAPLDESK